MVVATRNRARRLQALLESLAVQRDARFEVIVVVDGSTDDTDAVVAAAANDGMSLSAVRLEGEGRGPATARNVGWRRAGAPLVAFIDDDCVADGRWLAELLAAHRAAPGALVQGRTQADPAELTKLSAFSRSVIVEQLGPWFETCNIGYPKQLLERLGGFDEAFPAPALEDTDLALRALEAGAPAVFAPDALVSHAVHVPGALGLVRDASRWGALARLVKRHPEVREQLVHGVFWKPSHERLLLALLAVGLARRTRGASFGLVLPYLLCHRPDHNSLAGTAAALPAHALVDGAEVAALLAESAATRTLVV